MMDKRNSAIHSILQVEQMIGMEVYKGDVNN